MHISIEHFDGKYPQFNVSLHTNEGPEPFLVIKGCRIVSGSKGDFVSWPATKNEGTGKYWSHVYGSDAFSAAVLEKAQRNKPAAPPRQAPKPAPAGSGFDDMQDDSIPF